MPAFKERRFMGSRHERPSRQRLVWFKKQPTAILSPATSTVQQLFFYHHSCFSRRLRGNYMVSLIGFPMTDVMLYMIMLPSLPLLIWLILDANRVPLIIDLIGLLRQGRIQICFFRNINKYSETQKRLLFIFSHYLSACLSVFFLGCV